MSAKDLTNQLAIRKQLQKYVRPGLNFHQLEEIKKIFDTFDLQRNGLVNPRDLKKAIKTQGPLAQNSALYQLICDMDQQGAGMLTFQDFIFFMTPNVSGQESFEEIQKIFKLFDDQKTGRLNIRGLRRISKHLHLDFEEQDLQEMIRQADADGDGFVTCQQFYEAVNYKPGLL